MTCLLRTGSICLITATLAAPALADFTAQEYWDYTQQTARELGSEIRANSVTRTPNGLIIEGLTLTGEDDGNAFTIEMDGYTINNHPAGGVALELPASQGVSLTFDTPETAPFTLQFTLSQEGFSAHTTGTLLALDTVAAASDVQLSLDAALLDGNALDVSGGISLSGMDLVTEGISTDFSQPFSYLLDASEVTLAIDVNLPQVAVVSATATTFNDLSFVARVSPEDGPQSETIVLEATASASATAVQQTTQDTGALAYTARTGQLAYNVVVQDQFANLGTAMADVDIQGQAERLPIGPISLAADSISTELGFPIAATSDLSTAAMMLDLQGLRLGESIWRLFDPVAAVPRDPIHLTLEMDADLQVRPRSTPITPGVDDLPVDILPQMLRIGTLFAAFGGAELTGEGAFAFDPNDFPLAPGTPPTADGAIDLSLSGGLELLQRLTSAGLVSAEQAMGAQMMIGMLTRQGSDGALETRIETGADGSISVNGTQMR